MPQYEYVNLGVCRKSDDIAHWEEGIADISGEIVDTVEYDGNTVGVIVLKAEHNLYSSG